MMFGHMCFQGIQVSSRQAIHMQTASGRLLCERRLDWEEYLVLPLRIFFLVLLEPVSVK